MALTLVKYLFFFAFSRGQYNIGTMVDGGEREGVDFQSENSFSEVFQKLSVSFV